MRSLIIHFSLLILFLFGCHASDHKAEFKQPVIYTSIYPLQFIAERIAGDFATTDTIYPPGVDAHHYELTAQDMMDLSKGDVFIYFGEHMESFSPLIIQSLDKKELNVIEVTAKESISIEGEDPHIWIDPLRMIQIAKVIHEELCEVFPPYEQTMTENLTHLIEDLEKLDQAYIQTLETKKNKTALFFLDAYGYWEKRYGIHPVPIFRDHEEHELSVQKLLDIANIIEKENLTSILLEVNDGQQVGEVLQEHFDLETYPIHNLEVLRHMDLERNEDYLSLMHQNLHVLDQVLE